MNSRLTIRRITSRGVKCSPAVSLEISANLRISSSNTRPIWSLSTALGCRSMRANFSVTWYSSLALRQPLDWVCEFEALEDVAHSRREALDVAEQVGADVVLVAHELLMSSGETL